MTDPFALLFVTRLEKLVYLRRAVHAIWHEDNWRRRLIDRGIYSTVSDLRAMGISDQAERVMATSAQEKRSTTTAMHDGCNSDPDQYTEAMCETCSKRESCFNE